jgi:hypothetical protein
VIHSERFSVRNVGGETPAMSLPGPFWSKILPIQGLDTGRVVCQPVLPPVLLLAPECGEFHARMP